MTLYQRRSSTYERNLTRSSSGLRTQEALSSEGCVPIYKTTAGSNPHSHRSDSLKSQGLHTFKFNKFLKLSLTRNKC